MDTSFNRSEVTHEQEIAKALDVMQSWQAAAAPPTQQPLLARLGGWLIIAGIKLRGKQAETPMHTTLYTPTHHEMMSFDSVDLPCESPCY